MFDQVFKFYSSELVYLQPNSTKPTECYFPICKYTLDTDSLYEWLCDQEESPVLYEKVLDSVFNKDKEKVKQLIEDVSKTKEFEKPSYPFEQLSDCSWWSLPKSTVQQLLQYTGKTSWTLSVYKNSDGTWGFDIPELLTKNEKFINGTEKVLDQWYLYTYGTEGQWDENDQPIPGEKLTVTISSEFIPNSTTTLLYWEDDNTFSKKGEGSLDKPSYYFDTKIGLKLWLCQYLQFLFQSKPETLWVNVTKG